MLLTLTAEDLDAVEPHGTLALITGTAKNGDRVTFGADARTAQGMALFADELGEIIVKIEGWQVLGVEASA